MNDFQGFLNTPDFDLQLSNIGLNNTLINMQAIRRIISKTDFKKYAIPDNFAAKAEVIILPFNDQDDAALLMEDDETDPINNMVPENQQNNSKDDNMDWEDYFGIKREESSSFDGSKKTAK